MKQSLALGTKHPQGGKRNKRAEKVLIEIFLIYIYIIFVIIFSFLIDSGHRKTYLFYYAIISISVTLAGLASIMKKGKRFHIFYTLSFLILFFILAFRNVSAIDDPTYLRIFNEVASEGWFARFIATTMEPGYLLLNQIVYTFTDNYIYMQIIATFIPMFLIYFTFYRLRDKISIHIGIFIFLSMFYFQVLSVGLIRHFIALSIVFFAFYYIPKKETMKYIALILLASTFHYSSLFMLILAVFTLERITISKKTKAFIIAAFIGIPLAFFLVYKFIIPILGDRYQNYATIRAFSIRISDFDTLPLLILCLMFRKKVKKENLEFFMLGIAIYSLSTVVSLYASVISLGRLIFYTNSAFYFLAPTVKKELGDNYKALPFTAIIILYGIIYVFWTQFNLGSHAETLFPYQNVFFQF